MIQMTLFDYVDTING